MIKVLGALGTAMVLPKIAIFVMVINTKKKERRTRSDSDPSRTRAGDDVPLSRSKNAVSPALALRDSCHLLNYPVMYVHVL